MTVPEYLKKLQLLKDQAVSRWGKLSSLERDVVDGSFEWLVNNLEIKRGEIIVDEDLSRIMDEFVQAAVNVVNEVPAFQSNLKRFLQDLTTIQTNNKLFHRTTNNFNIETAGVNDVQKAIVGQIIDQYTSNGLNAHFAAPLKENIFRNILAGANMKEVKQVLQAYILSGQDQSGKLASYLGQTAQQAVDSYTGAINQKLVEEFKFDGYIISGSLIETSSKQCIKAVNDADSRGFLTFNEWLDIIDFARDDPKSGLVPGTNVRNLPLNKLHWGCRHDFTPVVMRKAKEPAPEPKKEEQPQPKTAEFKPAKTVKEAKERTLKVIKDGIGLNATKVVVSSDFKLDKFNAYLETITNLVNEYKISTPAIYTNAETVISFRSNRRYYGAVTTIGGGRHIKEINFGHQTDNGRSTQVDPSIAHLRGKSATDPDKEQVATVVHEFTHVMGIEAQESRLEKTDLDNFWNELRTIRTEYKNELKSILEKNNNDKEYSEIFLGRYASTNLNEFMAEGFTEYKLKTNPSKYAKKIGLLIDKYFKK